MAEHLSNEQLALFEDGELSGRESRHLESCPECGLRLRERQAAAAMYLEYRDSVRQPALAPPPKPWPSLDTLIRANEETGIAKSFRWWPTPALAMAACLILAILVLYRTIPDSSPKESTRANELLAESSRTELPEGSFISLRARGRSLVRPAVLTVDAEEGMADVRQAFVAASYSWREPLSARSFEAWRQGLKRKRDFVSVIRQHDKPRAYRVRTETPAGVLRSASLTLRAKDLRPTSGTFDFETLGLVELAESAVPAPSQAVTKTPPGEDSHAETPASPEDMLHVLAALDSIGADVGEPVTVETDAQQRHIVVRANGLDLDRQRQIAQALAQLPRVALNLNSSELVPQPARHPSSETYSSHIPEAVRQQLDDRLGGPAARQEATDRVLEASASALARANALELLAEKFPRETSERFAQPDRELLRSLRSRHAAELSRLLARIREDLKPLLPPSATLPLHPGDNENIAALATELDKSLNLLLAGSYPQSSGEEMLRMLGPRIDRLERAIPLQQQGR